MGMKGINETEKMNSFLRCVRVCKKWFNIKQLETDYISGTKVLDMTDKQSDSDPEGPPKKKICVGEEQEKPNVEKVNNVEKINYRKVALLLSYVGDNYYGLQRNSTVKTIEGELLSALCKAKCIPPGDPYKLYFQRTARTDKGVSAAKQVVSLNIAEKSSVENINMHLPEDIRVLAFKRVTKGFHCQYDCCGRVYSYTLPTFALAPEFHEEYPKNHRISQEVLQKTNEILISYVGTHNFHNFTLKKQFQDPSAKRYIMNFIAGEPFISEGEEFITLTVKGQSFMLHQIRKMVGHMIAILKGVTPPNIQTDIWSEQKYSVPVAPGLGLVLEDVLFNRYNRKFENDGIHGSLAFDELAEDVKNFKNIILSRILQKEMEQKVMFQWLTVLKTHSYVKEETPGEESEKSEVLEDEIAN